MANPKSRNGPRVIRETPRVNQPHPRRCAGPEGLAPWRGLPQVPHIKERPRGVPAAAKGAVEGMSGAPAPER
jgi:hypothetical protein